MVLSIEEVDAEVENNYVTKATNELPIGRNTSHHFFLSQVASIWS